MSKTKITVEINIRPLPYEPFGDWHHFEKSYEGETLILFKEIEADINIWKEAYTALYEKGKKEAIKKGIE